MKKTLVSLVLIVMGVMTSLGGPIIGLIDRATGAEVPDADVRYVTFDTNNVVLNGSLTVRSSTGNVFLLNCPTKQSVSTSLVFSLAHVTNIAIPFVYPEVGIAAGRLYSTSNGVYSKTTTLTFYSGNDYKGSSVYWRANIPLISTPINTAVVAPTRAVILSDSSGFAANDLVYFTQSNEFGRISSIVGNTLTLEDDVRFGHATTSFVSRVGEFGGFNTIDDTGTSNAFVQLDATNTTQILRFDIRYRR